MISTRAFFVPLLTVFAWLIGCSSRPAAEVDTQPPNILLVSIDTLRARNLSTWGYDRETSPWLSELASRGVRFEHAFVNTHGTTPSHATLFSSLYQESHGVALDGDPRSAVPDSVLMLAEVLRENGYRTVAVTGGGNVGAAFGFGQGFDTFDDLARSVEEGTGKLLAYLEETPGDTRPVFAFYHSYEVHSPYESPPEYDDLFGSFASDFEPTSEKLLELANRARQELTETDLAHVTERYDTGIRHTDDVLRQLVTTLEERGWLEDALVLFTSDHGEELAEHGGLLHRALLFDELLHVPLIAFGSDLPAGRTVSEPVSLVDVAPTLLQCAGLPIPGEMQGRPLLCLAAEPEPADVVVSQYGRLLYSVRSDRWKLIETVEPQRTQLFDLLSDPLEQQNVAEEHPETVKGLRRRLFEWRQQQSQLAETAEAGLTAEGLERLEALGYLGDGEH